jgi:hypothetical protein
MTMKTLRKKVDKRVWHENENKTLFVFLVDKPITFGHSQLVMSISPGTHEEEVFKKAADHIAICIGRFRSTFMPQILEEWGPLAKYTGTSWPYVKTLILRASANEDQGKEYKVHLVPCFASHQQSANDLFQARFGGSDAGGLLHWIGEREHLVDYDKEMSPSSAVSDERINSFCLTGLAAILRCPMQPSRTA